MTLGLVILLMFVGILTGGALLIWGFSSNSDFAVLPAILGAVLMVGSFAGGMGYADHMVDKEHCLKDLPQISQRETKWLNSECYVKANDGKFVPLEWIEEGYERR